MSVYTFENTFDGSANVEYSYPISGLSILMHGVILPLDAIM